MSLARVAVEKQTVTVFATAMILLAGVASFFSLGQLEDPEFTIKTAVIATAYPGASPTEVELEVTDRIEIAVQELPQIKEIESYSRAGLSVVKAFVKPSYGSAELTQIWDELRKKIRDASAALPPGAGNPIVSDDFGDVFGFLLSVIGDGYSYAELQEYVEDWKKELSLLDGVARVELWGQLAECIYVEVSEAQLTAIGLTPADMQITLAQQNAVVDSGGIDVGGTRLRIETTGEFSSPEAIGELVVRGGTPGASSGTDELIRLRDIAEIRRGYIEPPNWELRSDGENAIGLAISNSSGVNIVELGKRIDQKLNELIARSPVGIEARRVAWQSDLVETSISGFVISLAEAVLIVLIVLWIAMGVRIAIIVGLCGLVFTIVITFLLMAMTNVDLQRMSLGALVIAMGMMVDNAIVVVDGIAVRFQQGMDRKKAAIEAASQPAMPLLGATIVAVLAFYPIYASEESAGEYCATLFSVVGLSLMVSWVLSVTITPIMSLWLLPTPKGGTKDPYGGVIFTIFGTLLRGSMRYRRSVVFAMVLLLAGSMFSFRYINKMFFPSSTRAQFMVDYWAPEGTRIQKVSDDLKRIEAHIASRDGVSSVTSYIGQGPPRFYLPVEPESPYSSYAQLIVNTDNYKDVQSVLEELQPWVDQQIAGARVVLRKYGLGPSETWPVQIRVSGPAVADAGTLRGLADEVAGILESSDEARIVRTNWRQRVPRYVIQYDQENARWTSVSRSSIANATRRAYDGLAVGVFRDQDKLLPILVRHTQEEREQVARGLDLLQVNPPLRSESVPLSQVTGSLELEWEDPMIWRWDRRRAITVQAVPMELATTLREDVLGAVDAVELPSGYTLEWDGEYLSSKDAQKSLLPGVVPAVVVVAIIIVGLFNAIRPPLIIALLIPFALIGVSSGLLVTGQPLGFVALLGAMSLAGMMIKNAIVLLDQINIEKESGSNEYDAVIAAAMSRLRPVLLAAATTVLGVAPLLQDVFWVAMAVTIMFGLAFGTILTMIAVPVLYAIMFRVKASSS
jgi:multidrug efflux pump subunit AcrB